MKTVLNGRGVHKVFGGKNQHMYTALHKVDVDIKRGEFVAIMGPSGAGKTTLLNILATIDKPTAGSIVIDGEETVLMKEEQLAYFRRKKLGFIFQDYNLLDFLTIKENIVLPLSLTGEKPRVIEERAEELLGVFGIAALAEKYPYQVSGGQQQRTAAARAIITKPSIVLADEPTGALDSKSAIELLQTLTILNRDLKTTILMVTHDPHAASFCHRVIFMKDGNLYTELGRGDKKRGEFYKQLVHTLSSLGGDVYDDL